MAIGRYKLIGISLIVVLSIFLLYSDGEPSSIDFKGIVSDVNESSTGFTFILNTYDGPIHCFFTECPEDMKYYGVEGDFSQDGTILFVNELVPLE